MNFRERLIEKIKQKKSVVCMGIDPDTTSKQFPKQLFFYEAKPKLEFAKMLIDETHDLIPIIKLNTRFYFINESDQLKEIVKYAHKHDLEVIGDCKENDIGNTMGMAYRKQFEGFDFDAITVNPYFGKDGIIGNDEKLFQKWFEKGKGLFVLIRTSNKSSNEIQKIDDLYLRVADLVDHWSYKYEWVIGGVVGATHSEELELVRDYLDGILLIPGFGAQGGKVEDIVHGFKKSRNLYSIINSSRGIMYAYDRRFKGNFNYMDFAKASRKEIMFMNKEINKHIKTML